MARLDGARKVLAQKGEFVPSAVRVGLLANPTGASMQFFAHSIEEAARDRGILLLTEEATTPEEISPALGRLARQQPQAIIAPLNGLFRNAVDRIVASYGVLAVLRHCLVIDRARQAFASARLSLPRHHLKKEGGWFVVPPQDDDRTAQ